MNISALLKNNERVQEIVQVATTNNDWESAYDIIFPTHVRGVRAADPDFSWYDPDSSYQDDVLAFANALKERAERLAAFEVSQSEIDIPDVVNQITKLLNILQDQETGNWNDVLSINTLRMHPYLKMLMKGETE
jgi:hypothetical protein